MQRIIKNNEVIDETWHLLPKDASFDDISNCDDLIVPLAMWREHAHCSRPVAMAYVWKPSMCRSTLDRKSVV